MATYRQITDVRKSEKWLEFWSRQGVLLEYKDFDFCAKIGAFERAIETAGLSTHVLKHGILGLWVEVDEGNNIKSVARCLSEFSEGVTDD